MAQSTTLDALHQRVIKELWPGRFPLIATTTGAGSTSSLVIAAAAYSSASVNAYDGKWVYCPSVTTGIKCSKVTRGGFTVASGTLTMSPVYGSSPGSGVSAYFLGLHIAEIDEAINNILRTLYLPRYLALPGLITDGDMEASGVTSWADVVGTPTQTKETTIVFTGKQSLKLVIATSAHAVTSDAIPVDENEQLYCAAMVRCDVGSLTVQLYDYAADTVLASTTVTAVSPWTLVMLPGVSVPSASNRVTVRLAAGSDSTTAYVDFAQLLSGSRNVYAVPTALNNLSDVEGIYCLRPYQATGVNYSYVADRDFQPWSSPDGWRDYPGVNSNLVNVGRPRGYPLFVMFRDTDTVLAQNTSDTSTTFATEELVVQGALADLHQRLYDKTQDTFHAREAVRCRRIYHSLLQAEGMGRPKTIYRPQRRVSVG